MSNKFKRNLFLGLLIIEAIAYIIFACFSSQIDSNTKWVFYVPAAILFIFFIGGYRNFSQAVKEDEKYGPIKKA